MLHEVYRGGEMSIGFLHIAVILSHACGVMTQLMRHVNNLEFPSQSYIKARMSNLLKVCSAQRKRRVLSV